MYVVPNTTIRLIKNCPLDKSQENTIYFTSVSAQTTYFTSTLQGFLFQANSYQRVSKNTLRVAMNVEALYNCNYLAFQNASFGGKWFYAFVDSVEYVNNVTSEVTYTIDVMQTWHFQYQLEMCFVEREHSVTDYIGDNLVPEKLETGELISDDYLKPSILDSLVLCVWATFTYQDDQHPYVKSGGVEFNQGYGSYFSGLTPTIFPLTTPGIDDCIAWMADIPISYVDKVVSVNVLPSASFNALARTFSTTKKTTLMRSDGTGVKNKKCLTYPYNALYVTNNQGKSAIYRYEFFSTDTCDFSVFADASPHPTALMYPQNYKGLSENFDEKIDLNGYPQVGYAIDSYKAWLAQSASSIGINALAAGMYTEDYMIASTAAKSASTALVTSNMAGAGASFLPSVGLAAGAAIPLVALASLAVSGTIHAMMPPQARGNQGSNVLQALGKLNFGVMHKHITPEFATIIDDYFTMFGYATNKVKVPNRTARPEWNYIKTIGCKITMLTGGMPADDADEIEQIYNRGVRFWTNPAHIGDYSYDNSPSI